jgi:hypothetical protein
MEAATTQTYDGSTALPDRKREAFVQELVAGEDLYAAYETAGFKRPRGNAQRMQQEPEVCKRLEFLGRQLAPLDEALRGYRRLQHRRALEHIAVADRLSLFEEKTFKIGAGVDRKGKPRYRNVKRLCLKPLEDLTAEQRALIDGVKVSEKGAIEVLMPKRLDARAMLAKLDGLDGPTKIEATGKDGVPLVPEYTDEQRVKALTALLAKTGGHGAAAA